MPANCVLGTKTHQIKAMIPFSALWEYVSIYLSWFCVINLFHMLTTLFCVGPLDTMLTQVDHKNLTQMKCKRRECYSPLLFIYKEQYNTNTRVMNDKMAPLPKEKKITIPFSCDLVEECIFNMLYHQMCRSFLINISPIILLQ